MSDKAISFYFERGVTLEPLWYDEQWHQQLLDEGWTEEGALKEMLRFAYEEDWTSLIQELMEGDGSYADVFVDSVTAVRVVELES